MYVIYIYIYIYCLGTWSHFRTIKNAQITITGILTQHKISFIAEYYCTHRGERKVSFLSSMPNGQPRWERQVFPRIYPLFVVWRSDGFMTFSRALVHLGFELGLPHPFSETITFSPRPVFKRVKRRTKAWKKSAKESQMKQEIIFKKSKKKKKKRKIKKRTWCKMTQRRNLPLRKNQKW